MMPDILVVLGAYRFVRFRYWSKRS